MLYVTYVRWVAMDLHHRTRKPNHSQTRIDHCRYNICIDFKVSVHVEVISLCVTMEDVYHYHGNVTLMTTVEMAVMKNKILIVVCIPVNTYTKLHCFKYSWLIGKATLIDSNKNHF